MDVILTDSDEHNIESLKNVTIKGQVVKLYRMSLMDKYFGNETRLHNPLGWITYYCVVVYIIVLK